MINTIKEEPLDTRLVRQIWTVEPNLLRAFDEIPEPSTALLLATGLAAMAVGRRRRAQ